MSHDSHSGSAEERELARSHFMIGEQTVEVESSNLDVALVMAAALMFVFAAYQTYKRWLLKKEVEGMQASTARSSHAIVNGQVVY